MIGHPPHVITYFIRIRSYMFIDKSPIPPTCWNNPCHQPSISVPENKSPSLTNSLTRSTPCWNETLNGLRFNLPVRQYPGDHLFTHLYVPCAPAVTIYKIEDKHSTPHITSISTVESSIASSVGDEAAPSSNSTNASWCGTSNQRYTTPWPNAWIIGFHLLKRPSRVLCLLLILMFRPFIPQSMPPWCLKAL